MANDEIVEYPHPALSRPASTVQPDEFGSAELKELIERMEQITHRMGANGLAAPQIDVDKAVILYRNKYGTLKALCNPIIIARSGKVKSYDEGCLSSPGFRLDIRRSKIIRVKAYTTDGEEIILKEQGFTAIILQHEIDHINGITLIRQAPDNNDDKRQYMRRIKHDENISF